MLIRASIRRLSYSLAHEPYHNYSMSMPLAGAVNLHSRALPSGARHIFDGMPRIGMQELRQKASRYLAIVKAGRSVEVIEHGLVVAVHVPPDSNLTARDQLVKAGRLVPAKIGFRRPRRRALVDHRRSASESLEALRGDRLS